MAKIHTSITVDPMVWSSAKAKVNNISGFVEDALRLHLSLEEGMIKESDKSKQEFMEVQIMSLSKQVEHLKGQLIQSQKEKKDAIEQLEAGKSKYSRLTGRNFK